MAAQYQPHEYDALVIGAGGAGLRAAIEAAATPGVTVGLVCKSLLGKAHTVMAEGGSAAALGNTDERDNWKVHFADTMRGGQYINNWRMAELHAREAPDRVRELEAWGALFDRTKGGRILRRNFGGRRRRAAASPPKACAARAASSRTRTAAASCSTTAPTTTRTRRRTTKRRAGATRRATSRPSVRRSCSRVTTSR